MHLQFPKKCLRTKSLHHILQAKLELSHQHQMLVLLRSLEGPARGHITGTDGCHRAQTSVVAMISSATILELET